MKFELVKRGKKLIANIEVELADMGVTASGNTKLAQTDFLNTDETINGEQVCVAPFTIFSKPQRKSKK